MENTQLMVYNQHVVNCLRIASYSKNSREDSENFYFPMAYVFVPWVSSRAYIHAYVLQDHVFRYE